MMVYEVRLTPITPIHIGTGDELMPFSYTIMPVRSMGKNNEVVSRYRYIRFNDEIMVRYLKPEQLEKLQPLIDQDDFGAFRQEFNAIVQHLIPVHQDCIFYTARVTDEVLALWAGLSEKRNNSFIVQPILSNLLSKQPYIPGSSLKGAIRTALLDPFAREFFNIPPKFREQGMLATLEHMKDGKYKAQDDPLRVLKVSDAIFPAKNSRLVGQLALYNREKQATESIAINEEVIESVATRTDVEDSVASALSATASISIDDRLLGAHAYHTAPRTIEDIIKSCNDFYENTLAFEYNRFFLNADDEVYNGYTYVDKAFEEMHKRNSKSEFIVRLGRHSQIEYMTFATEREAERKAANRVSRTLFRYKKLLLPMGWLHCEVLSKKSI